jgi:hypothetical protein
LLVEQPDHEALPTIRKRRIRDDVYLKLHRAVDTIRARQSVFTIALLDRRSNRLPWRNAVAGWQLERRLNRLFPRRALPLAQLGFRIWMKLVAFSATNRGDCRNQIEPTARSDVTTLGKSAAILRRDWGGHLN